MSIPATHRRKGCKNILMCNEKFFYYDEIRKRGCCWIRCIGQQDHLTEQYDKLMSFYFVITYDETSVNFLLIFMPEYIFLWLKTCRNVKHDIFFFLWRYSPNLGLRLPPWNSTFHFGFLDLRQSVGLLGGWSARRKHRKTHIHTQTLNIHALSGIRNHDPGFRASEDSACLRLRLLGRPRHSSSG
jgi:hypothetical protein